MRVGERRPPGQVQRQIGDEPFVRVEESQLDGIGAGDVANDARHGRAVVGDLVRAGPRTGDLLRQRLQVRLDGGDLRDRGADRELDLLGDLMGLVEREVAGELDVERDLGSASGSRCVWTEVTSGTAERIASSTSSAISWASSSERSPGSLMWSETSVPPPTE